MIPLRVPLGLLLVGYGALVLVGVMPHDALLAGALSLALGLLLLAFGLASLPAVASVAPGRSRLVAALGGTLVLGVVAYNVLSSSWLSAPEWAILAYGILLLCASPFLGHPVGRTSIGTLVGWSFPLLLAPLALFALNGAMSSESTGTAASPFVQALVVHPTAALLRLSGMSVELHGSTMLVPTPRGTLSLGVGLVCAGLYPIVLFAGLVGLHAWTDKIPPKRAALLVAAGIGGLWLLNLVRLVALTRVGVAWGPAALQQAHANLGWILFALYMCLFWAVALRRKPAAVPAT